MTVQGFQNVENIHVLIAKALDRTASPEYTEALELLEPHGEYMTDSHGDEHFVIRVPRAADLIADNYERRGGIK